MLRQMVYKVTTGLYTVKGKNSVQAVRARAVNGRLRYGEAMRQNFSEGFCCTLSIRIPPTSQIYSCLRLGIGNRPATGAVPRDSPQQYWPNTSCYAVHFSTFPFSCLISTLRRRDSSVGIATRLRTGRSGGWIPLNARDFCLLHNVHTGSEAHPVSCSVGTKVLCRGVQRPGRGVDHLPPSTAGVKNEWSCNSTHPMHSWRGQKKLQFLMTLFDQKCLITWGDNNCE